MTPEEIVKEMQTESPLNRARRLLSSHCGRIEQLDNQRKPLDIFAMRNMEFDTVRAIAKELGVTL